MAALIAGVPGEHGALAVKRRPIVRINQEVGSGGVEHRKENRDRTKTKTA